MENREIKFRGWDVAKKKMYNPFEFIKSGDSKCGIDWIVWGSTMKQFHENWKNKSVYPRQRFELMQYTGLKDNKLVEKSADATKESQKIQGSINKLNDKITSVKEKITDIENKMSKQSWGVQLVPQN